MTTKMIWNEVDVEDSTTIKMLCREDEDKVKSRV